MTADKLVAYKTSANGLVSATIGSEELGNWMAWEGTGISSSIVYPAIGPSCYVRGLSFEDWQAQIERKANDEYNVIDSIEELTTADPKRNFIITDYNAKGEPRYRVYQYGGGDGWMKDVLFGGEGSVEYYCADGNVPSAERFVTMTVALDADCGVWTLQAEVKWGK